MLRMNFPVLQDLEYVLRIGSKLSHPAQSLRVYCLCLTATHPTPHGPSKPFRKDQDQVYQSMAMSRSCRGEEKASIMSHKEVEGRESSCKAQVKSCVLVCSICADGGVRRLVPKALTYGGLLGTLIQCRALLHVLHVLIVLTKSERSRAFQQCSWPKLLRMYLRGPCFGERVVFASCLLSKEVLLSQSLTVLKETEHGLESMPQKRHGERVAVALLTSTIVI